MVKLSSHLKEIPKKTPGEEKISTEKQLQEKQNLENKNIPWRVFLYYSLLYGGLFLGCTGGWLGWFDFFKNEAIKKEEDEQSRQSYQEKDLRLKELLKNPHVHRAHNALMKEFNQNALEKAISDFCDTHHGRLISCIHKISTPFEFDQLPCQRHGLHLKMLFLFEEDFFQFIEKLNNYAWGYIILDRYTLKHLQENLEDVLIKLEQGEEAFSLEAEIFLIVINHEGPSPLAPFFQSSSLFSPDS